MIALDGDNVLAVISALEPLGYRPRAPVAARDFADPLIRRSWVEDKGLVVFTLWSPEHPTTEIDIFVEEPFPFDEAFARASTADLGTANVAVASIADLIDLKRRAGRPKDLLDIAALEALTRDTDDG